jgi:hypothetical protein
MAADLVGNTARFNFTVLRDSTAPNATYSITSTGAPIVRIDDVAHTRETSVTIIVTMSEAGIITVNGQTHTASQGENSLIQSLVEGQNEFRFTIRDGAGTPGAPLTLVVIRDTAAPAISLTKPRPGEVVVGTSFLVEGTAEPGSTVWINGEEVPLSSSGAFSKSLPLENGTTSVTVRAMDALGNEDDVVVSVTRGEEYVPPPPPEQDFTMSILFLAVGIGAGVGVGFMLRARGSSAMRKELAQAEDMGQAPEEGAAPQAGPAPAPRGPRGPQPPPGSY